jgi:hypothetical protein
MNTYRDELEDVDDDGPPSGGWDLFFHGAIIALVLVLAFAVARDTALFGRPEERRHAMGLVGVAVFGVVGVALFVWRRYRRR